MSEGPTASAMSTAVPGSEDGNGERSENCCVGGGSDQQTATVIRNLPLDRGATVVDMEKPSGFMAEGGGKSKILNW